MDKFHIRLKENREKRKTLDSKWTQGYIAEKIGVARVTYTAYENGTKQPPLDTVNKIADVLEVSTDYLLGRTDDSKNNAPVTVAGQEINLSIEELQLFNELKKHPIMFHDLASDPEKKVKELIMLYKAKKILLNEDDIERGDGFGELED